MMNANGLRQITRWWLPAMLVIGITATSGKPAIAGSSAVVGTPFERHEIKDSFGRQITYYSSHPKKPAPLLIMIQGSGCVPLMNTKGKSTYSTLFDLLPLGAEENFTVIAVEKPFSADASQENTGKAESCSSEFNADFTAERWLAALQASIRDALLLSWVRHDRILILGQSEGAVMAALLAGNDPSITDVISIGGSGTTQLFDFVAGAYRRCFNVSPCLAEIDQQVRNIAADPTSSTRFAWGHPYKRWSSFFRVDPSDELLKSKARVYIAFGTDDRATPPLSQEIAVAKLTSAGRDVTVRRVPDADHSLLREDVDSFGDLDKEIRTALNWFFQSRN
jgi:pimeloyl-ACP methyl ester carboxylesterase